MRPWKCTHGSLPRASPTAPAHKAKINQHREKQMSKLALLALFASCFLLPASSLLCLLCFLFFAHRLALTRTGSAPHKSKEKHRTNKETLVPNGPKLVLPSWAREKIQTKLKETYKTTERNKNKLISDQILSTFRWCSSARGPRRGVSVVFLGRGPVNCKRVPGY